MDKALFKQGRIPGGTPYRLVLYRGRGELGLRAHSSHKGQSGDERGRRWRCMCRRRLPLSVPLGVRRPAALVWGHGNIPYQYYIHYSKAQTGGVAPGKTRRGEQLGGSFVCEIMQLEARNWALSPPPPPALTGHLKTPKIEQLQPLLY